MGCHVAETGRLKIFTQSYLETFTDKPILRLGMVMLRYIPSKHTTLMHNIFESSAVRTW